MGEKNEKIVILGTGIAAVSAAEEIRRTNQSSQILMIGEEKDRPYIRPLLSKTGLLDLRRDRILLRDESWYRDSNVTLMTGRTVRRILCSEKKVLLTDGAVLDYDKCIYALGARSVVPPVKGSDKRGVMTVRTTEDMRRIRRSLAAAENAVVIGGGTIGLEIAWQIRRTGCGVTILEAGPRIMGRFLDAGSSRFLRDLCEKQGITVLEGVQVTEITGEEQADGVKLSDGSAFPAELVILSCGVRPNTEAAAVSGIACGRGVLTDEFLRTNVPDIFAAGDCVEWNSPNPGSWLYSRETGAAAGHNAVCREEDLQRFKPRTEPVLLSAMGVDLFAAGNTKDEECDRIELRSAEDGPGSEPAIFRVNFHPGEKIHYAKKFFRGEKLCGAVLIGDLWEMAEIRAALEGENSGVSRRCGE